MARTHSSRARTLVFAGAAGLAAVVLGAGLGELVAGLFAPTASPFAVIGGALIDIAPPWAKETAIALFGTADKVALLVGIGIVLLAVAAAAGVLEAVRAPWGRIVALAFGVVGVVVSFTRPDASALSWIPSAVAGIAAAMTLGLLMRRLPDAGVATAEQATTDAAAPGDAAASARPEASARPAASARPEASAPPAASGVAAASAARDPDRRSFLVWTGAAAGLGVLAALGGSALRGTARAVTVVRDALRLPAPAVAAAPIPAGAELGIPELTPVITPNADFYRIDTALVVPQLDPAEWSLRIHGLVENEVVLTWDELLALPLEESVTTLTCVSNEVGGDLIGNALWLGYPIRELLARAKPKADADMVLSRSSDGFTASTPIEALTDDRNAILAVGMNGEPLPSEHGFPVRMVVPGLYGYVSATKWVVELEVTRFDAVTAYWTDRGWSERGPIKLQSRIDVPRSGVHVPAGDIVIAGVAWQQHVGVAGVEVQIDDGPWRDATLASAISDDTWVQWSLTWAAEPGSHRIRCRAISADGETQTEDEQGVIPDGATGWDEHTALVD